MTIQVLIVDDEPLARERIALFLRDEPGIEIVGEARNGEEAVSAIRKLRPQLVFLDIQMPGMNGFEVLRALPRESLPVVIFVTAYDQHAVKAFEVHALDYLLKPFKQARLKQALARAREFLAARPSGSANESLLRLLEQLTPPREFLSRFVIKTGDRTIFVKASQIDYAEAAGNYVVLHTARGNHVIRDTLSALEEKLDPKKFVRVNRSTIVNADQIKELQPMFKGEHVLVLHNGKQLPLTRGVRELEEILRFS